MLEVGALEQGDGFRTGIASYVSEGLTITGMLYVPDGDGPFPGVVVVHGSVDPAFYTTGSDLVREQEAFARSGHVVFSTRPARDSPAPIRTRAAGPTSTWARSRTS